MDRITQLQQAHSWLSIDNARLLLCRTYLELHSRYDAEQVPALLQEHTDAFCKQTQHQLKDTLSILHEFTNT
jgi:hypothetical protein